MMASLKQGKSKIQIRSNVLNSGSCNIFDLPEIDYITSIYSEKKKAIY